MSDGVRNTLVGACVTAVGWMFIQTYNLQSKMAATEATRFTQDDGNDLRNHLTGILTDIDKRIALSENNINWMRETSFSHFDSLMESIPASAEADVSPAAPAPPAPVEEELSVPFKGPRYDLQQHSLKE